MTSFWRLYSICLTILVLGIQLLQWQFPTFVQEYYRVTDKSDLYSPEAQRCPRSD